MSEIVLNSILTFFLSMTPIIELRGSIPVGYLLFDLPLWWTVLISVCGNIIIVAILLWTLPKVILFFDKRLPLVRSFFTWVFEKTQAKHAKKWIIFAELLLVIFVALPIPGSGGWTGSLLAYIFGVKNKNAFVLISIGICIAAIFVTLLTLGGHLVAKTWFS